MMSLTIFFCHLNFVVKSANILDNLEVTKSSKCSFFHNKAIFEMTLSGQVRGNMYGDL